MLNLLRSVFPPIERDFNDKFKKHEDNLPFERYEDIIDVCDNVIDIFVLIDTWLKQGEFGDCWNIASICAQFQTYRNKSCFLVAINGSNIAHLECLTGDIESFTCWRVDPYNYIPEDNLVFSCRKKVGWKLYEEAHRLLNYFETGKDDLTFTYTSYVRDGFHARQLIYDLFDYPHFVKFVDLELIKEKLNKNEYEIWEVK